MKSVIKLISSALFIVGVLNGCKDQGNSENGGGPSANSTYSAQNVVRETPLTDTLYINLNDNIGTSDGSTAQVTDVVPFSNNSDCQVLSISSSGFTVAADTANVCNYRYTVGHSQIHSMAKNSRSFSKVNSVSAANGIANAIVSVLAGDTTEVLSPISAVSSINTPVTIDPVKELAAYGEIIDPAYSLTDVSIPTAEITGSTVDINASEQTITYTPGLDFKGGERVLFSFTDGSNVKMGSIDIAVSEDANEAPTASDFDDGNINYNQAVSIDVGGYISDPNGDTLQLVDVFSYDGDITIPQDANGDGNFYNDTQFTFTSDKPGPHTLTYVISDAHGGYSVGLIQVIVNNVYSPIELDDENLVFLPPLTSEQAASANLSYEPGPVGNGDYSLDGVSTAEHNWGVANGLCATYEAELPSQEQIQKLYDAYPNNTIFHNKNWPTDVLYKTSDASTVMNLTVGNFSTDPAKAQMNYVTCVIETQSPPDGVKVKGADSISIGLTDPAGSKSYTLDAHYPDGHTDPVEPSEITWDLRVSDSYLTSSGVLTLHNTTGTIDYDPSLNTQHKEGNVQVKGCNADLLCDTKIVNLQDTSKPVSVTLTGPSSIDISQIASAGTATYVLSAQDSGGHTTNVDSSEVIWTMNPSESYFISYNVLGLDTTNGIISYTPSNNTQDKEGTVTIRACLVSDPSLCNTKIVNLQAQPISITIKGTSSIDLSQTSPAGTATYTLSEQEEGGQSIDVNSADVIWTMTPSDSYFLSYNVLDLDEIHGKISYTPSNNTHDEKGTVTVEGCLASNPSLCGSMSVELTVTEETCSDLSGPCIDTFDVGGGILYTNSPSAAYLSKIGYETVSPGWNLPDDEDGPAGLWRGFLESPVSGRQASGLCSYYNNIGLKGRHNWTLPSLSNIQTDLFKFSGNYLRENRGWNVKQYYRTSTGAPSTAQCPESNTWGAALRYHSTYDRICGSNQYMVSCRSVP